MATNDDGPTLRGVGAMARLFDKGEDTIRELERRGVITAIRDSANRRLFNEDQVRRLREHYGMTAA
jgi:DNA-binding transcriptional MerR regulator